LSGSFIVPPGKRISGCENFNVIISTQKVIVTTTTAPPTTSAPTTTPAPTTTHPLP